MDTPTTSALVSTQAVASRLGVKADTVRRWVKEGQFPDPVRRGKHWYFKAEAIDRWFGADRARAPEFAHAIAAGRAGQADAVPQLDRLVSDSEMPAIVRATALDLLGAYGAAAVPASTRALVDADPAVRRAAVTGLESVPAGQRLALVAPLLSDPVQAVRIEAARVLSSIPFGDLNPAVRPKFEAALAEFLAAQSVSLDMPGAHLNLAVLAENQANPKAAEAHYLHALKLDSDFTAARLNLSRLFSAAARNTDAERVLRDGIARVAGQGDL